MAKTRKGPGFTNAEWRIINRALIKFETTTGWDDEGFNAPETDEEIRALSNKVRDFLRDSGIKR